MNFKKFFENNELNVINSSSQQDLMDNKFRLIIADALHDLGRNNEEKLVRDFKVPAFFNVRSDGRIIQPRRIVDVREILYRQPANRQARVEYANFLKLHRPELVQAQNILIQLSGFLLTDMPPVSGNITDHRTPMKKRNR